MAEIAFLSEGCHSDVKLSMLYTSSISLRTVHDRRSGKFFSD